MERSLREHTWPGWSWVAMPLTAWLFGAWFHAGNLGKYCDDYHFGPFRDVTSQKWTWLFPFVFRPLMRILFPVLERLLWNHDALHHALQILAMGANALLFHLFLSRLGIARHGRIAATIIFLLHPALFELHFWVSAMATTLSIGCALGVLNLAQLHCRDGRGSRLAWMTLLASCVPCLNEQPAALFAMLPFLAWGIAPRGTRLGRGIALLLVAGVPCVVYVLLQRATIPVHWPGSTSKYAGVDEFLTRSAQIAREFTNFTAFGKFGESLMVCAWDACITHPLRVGLLCGACVVSSVGFVRVWLRDSERVIARPPPKNRTLLGACVGAMACIAASLAPVAMVSGYGLGIRMCFVMVFAVALWYGACAELLLRYLPLGATRVLVRRAGAGLIVGITLVFSFMLAGAQHALRQRWLADERLAGELRRSYPELPSWACVVPFENHERSPRTASRWFTNYFHGALSSPWASRGFVRRAYGRADLFSSWADPWGGLGHWNPREQGMDVFTPLDVWYKPPGPDVAPDWVFPWSHIAGVRIDENGRITRVSELIVPCENGEFNRYKLPLGTGGVPFVWR